MPETPVTNQTGKKETAISKPALPGFEETSFLFHGKNKPSLELSVRRCRQNELEDILALQQRVYEGIPDKKMFVQNTRDELSESLSEDICIGVYHKGKLAAFTLLVINRISPHSLACSLGLDEELCRRSVTYDTTFVDPRYTGYGLQRFLMALKDQYARKLGATEAYTTVAPENTVSLVNILSQGFEIVAEKPMYGGCNRFILRKTFSNTE